MFYYFYDLLFFSFTLSCATCKENNRARCYHWSVGDESSIAAFQDQLEEQLDLYLSNCGETYNEIQRKTKIVYDPCDIARENNIYNIDFIPNGGSDEEVLQATMFFSNLLTKELQLRKLTLQGNLEE
jgi:hypothetical protein